MGKYTTVKNSFRPLSETQGRASASKNWFATTGKVATEVIYTEVVTESAILKTKNKTKQNKNQTKTKQNKNIKKGTIGEVD